MFKSLLTLFIAATLAPESSTINFPTDIIENLKPVTDIVENFIPDTSAKPKKDPFKIAPVIDARSSLAVDLETNTVLYAKNIYERVPIASITKLMTAIVVLEKDELDKTYITSKTASSVEGMKIYLLPGEKITIENLLYAILIHSGNDAAIALAEATAGTTSDFIDSMNKKAKQLGLKNTHFANPVGLDEQDGYSNAYDLYLIAKYAYQYDFVKKAVKIDKMSISSTNGKIVHKLENTNQLLNSYLNIEGLKTGLTDEAKQCLVTVASDDDGNKIMTIILGSDDRFQESKILIDWVFRAYEFN